MRRNAALLLAKLVVVGLLAAALAAPLRAQLSTFSTFEAFALEGGEVLFRGEIRETDAEGVRREVTLYRDTVGKEIQRIEAAYRTDNLVLVSYKKVDHRTGERESMVYRDGVVTLRYRESADAEEETESLPWTEAMSFAAVLVPGMLRNWEGLRAGKTVEIAYLVPSRLETVGFRLTWVGEAAIGGRPAVHILMEASSWLIRRLVDPLHFYLAAEAPYYLLEYRGRTSLKTAAGDPLDARIVYTFPGRSEE